MTNKNRRIIIFDKKKNKVIYNKYVNNNVGCFTTNTKNLLIIDCLEQYADYEIKSLKMWGKEK